MNDMRDKAIDALSIHADLDDPTGTSIALDVALEVTMALILEAQADAWDEGDQDRKYATLYSTVAGANPYREEQA